MSQIYKLKEYDSGIIEYTYDIHKGYTGLTFTVYDDREMQKFVQDKVIRGRRGCLRGFHGDNNTGKLFICLKGQIRLIVVDCRKNSETLYQKYNTILSLKNRKIVYVPPGFINAHQGYGDYLLLYKWTEYYSGPDNQVTVYWNDKDIDPQWVWLPKLSDRDENCRTPLKSVLF